VGRSVDTPSGVVEFLSETFASASFRLDSSAAMSALGQKQTLTPINLMSVLPPIADIEAKKWVKLVKCAGVKLD